MTKKGSAEGRRSWVYYLCRNILVGDSRQEKYWEPELPQTALGHVENARLDYKSSSGVGTCPPYPVPACRTAPLEKHSAALTSRDVPQARPSALRRGTLKPGDLHKTGGLSCFA